MTDPATPQQSPAQQRKTDAPSADVTPDFIFDTAQMAQPDLVALQRMIGNRAVQRLLRKDTHLQGKRAGPVVQRAPGDPATPAQLIAAMLKALRPKVRQYVIDEFVKWRDAKKAEYDVLPAAWAFPVKLQSISTTCFQNGLVPLLQPECTRVHGVLIADGFFNFGLNEEDVHPIANLTDANENYLFGLLSGETFFAQTMPQIVIQHLGQMNDYLAKAKSVNVVATNSIGSLTEARTKLTNLIANHGQILGVAQGLGLVQLTDILTQRHQEAQNMLAQHTEASGQQTVDNCIQLHRDAASANITGPIITQMNTLIDACDQARFRYRKAAHRLNAQNIAAIQEAMNNQPRKARMAQLVAEFGVVWFDAIVGMDSDAQHLVLDHCATPQMVDAIKVQFPVGSTDVDKLSKVLARVGVPAAGGAALFNLMQQLHMTADPITLPGGVHANSWKLVGNNLVPAAFSGGNFETDMACLKHVKQETGVNPSKLKLERYFTELVSACQTARTQWVAAGRPDTNDSVIQLAVGRWHIIVKNAGGDAQIFHVDSQYEHSPWRNQPNA